MMKQCLLFTILLGSFYTSFSQIETPFCFKSEDDNKVVKETDSGKYYAATNDPEKTVFINDDLVYKLYDKDNKLLVEGPLSNDGEKYLHEGKWTEYYTNGKVKKTGYYHRDNPVGTWQKYYPNGRLMNSYSFTMLEEGESYYCMTGTYQEFFDNGQLKLSGLYKAVIDDRGKDTVYVEDPDTGKKTMKIMSSKRPRSERFGIWEYYNEKGELIKKEEI
jgi:antitoxin component YwqK of YwqJK toxin-antitoxin module